VLADARLAAALVLPALAILAVLEIYPLGQAVHDSFFSTDILTNRQAWVGLANFFAVFSSAETHEAIVRTLVWIVVGVGIQVAMGLVTALLLNTGLRGQTLARGLNLLPYMIPAFVVATSFRVSFNDVFGWVNYVLVSSQLAREPLQFFSDPHTVMLTVILASCWKYTPFMTIALLGRLQTLPRDMVEAATADGANGARVFVHIILPWLMPVLVVTTMLRTIWMTTEFDTPYLLAYGGPLQASTLVSMQVRSLYVDQLQVGPACALAIGVGVVLAAASVFYFRRYATAE
jgi:ABC-type sugar transport system permease subunit